MVEIIQNKENTEKIEFIVSDNGEKIGFCRGEVIEDTFVFQEMECEDFFIDGLVRALLNLMDLHGIEKAAFDFTDEGNMSKIQKLGFVKSDEKTIPNIAYFFGDNKKCGNSKN